MALPQPDFHAIAGNFKSVGDQFRLCANLPTYQGGQQVLDALHGIARQLQEVNQRLAGLEARSSAVDSNSMEGMTNKTVTKPDQQLEPLHALGTNEGIRDFPGTVEDIGTMGDTALDHISQELGQPTVDNLTGKNDDV
ncbi:hypothetical protein F4820DRAFT_73646 [Hypoxylon rubiginosum]|uniref:Uncharacterized protein n=1 Tax=Hypoxylon rubiginosum TaxID=110542 RepID=A0ACB9YQM6_9PEZI|nr:hypothetical protein F4820DRAFT_73646 [Hypoxylon rubiginosum]